MMTVFCIVVRLGTTMVPERWKGMVGWLAVSRMRDCAGLIHCPSRCCFACRNSCRMCGMVLLMYAGLMLGVSLS